MARLRGSAEGKNPLAPTAVLPTFVSLPTNHQPVYTCPAGDRRHQPMGNGAPNRLTLSYQDAVTMCTVTVGNGDLNNGDDPNLDEEARGLAPLVMAGDVSNCVDSMSKP